MKLFTEVGPMRLSASPWALPPPPPPPPEAPRLQASPCGNGPCPSCSSCSWSCRSAVPMASPGIRRRNCTWPTPAAAGRINYDTLLLNLPVVDVLVDHWCPINPKAKTLQLDEAKHEAILFFTCSAASFLGGSQKHHVQLYEKNLLIHSPAR